MAAEYEVNIKLNTKKIKDELKEIETSIAKIGKFEKQSVNTTDRRTAAMVKLRSVGDGVRKLEEKGLNVSKARLQVTKASQAIDKGLFKTADERLKVANKEIKAQKRITKELKEQQSIQQKTTGGSGTGQRTTGMGRRSSRLEQVGLGVGFPLLFGGGAGSVLGGGLGGLTGSFGAQIAFSAIGQQIDQFINGVFETGKAFGSLGETLDLMRERSLFTSKDSEELARQLENLGDVEALAELATIELASKIGSEGIEAFQDLETEIDEFDRLVQNLMLSLQAFLAGPLANFLDVLNATLGKQVTKGTIDRLAGSLSNPEDQERFRRAAKAQIGTEIEIGGRLGGLGLGLGGFPQSREVLKAAPLDLLSDLARQVGEGQFGPSSLTSRKVKITQQDRDTIKPPKLRKSDAERERERMERLMEQSRERIQLLELEAKKIGEITVFKDKIVQAERDGDEQLVIRLNTERKLAEIASKEDKLITKLVQTDLPAEQKFREQIAIQTQSTAQASEAIAEGQRQLADFQQKEDQRRAQAMQKYIEQQYALNTAVQQQLALVDGIANIMGQGMTQAFDALIDGADNWGRALQDIAANVLRDIAKQLIQIYLIEQAVGFLSNFLTPFSSSTPLGAGGGQIGKFGTLGPNYGIPQFANGGTPPVGRPSIVGERGPELFVPGARGTIVPNHAMGGANVTVNVDASGTQAQGNQPNAKLLGQAIGAAVQAELIKQKRPGGLLAA